MKLYCLSYAGGSSTTYLRIKKHFDSEIEVHPIELPGHGTRFDEKPYETIHDMAEDVYGQISEIGTQPYSILGYSMGGLIAYEFLVIATEHKFPLPRDIIIAACDAPHIEEDTPPIYQYEDRDFLRELVAMGGITQDDANDTDIMRIFLPVLRADFKAVTEFHKDKVTHPRIPCRATIMYSDVEASNYREWWPYFSQIKGYAYFKGDHFFINNDPIKFCRVVQDYVER